MPNSILRPLVVGISLVACGVAGAAETSLRMSSDPGDGIGEGREYLYTSADGAFVAQTNFANGASVNFNTPSFSHFWYLDFAAPHSEPLTIGTYLDATRFPFQAPEEPGLSVAGDGRGCNILTGAFRIKEVTYGSPGEIQSLWAIFEQHCEGRPPALRGDIRINADVLVAVSAPLSQTVETARPLVFQVSATDVVGRPVTLTATGLPDGSTFTDHGDNTGTFAWVPPFGVVGGYEVTFHGDNGDGGIDSSTTAISVLGTTSLLLDSEPGDYIGAGQILFFNSTEAGFASGPNSGGGVSTQVITPSFDHFWYLDFAAPFSAPLDVGNYLGATRYPFQEPSEPGLSVSGDGRGCNTVTGSFEVKQIRYGSGNSVEAFWATFEQHCEGGPAALRGELRVNADLPVLVRAPTAVTAVDGRELSFDVTGFDSLGGAVSLTVADVPAGATFSDHGDNTGTFRWTPTADQIGTHTVRFTAQNAQGDTDGVPTRITVRVANDDFDDAIEISGLPFSDSRDTSGATFASDDPVCLGFGPTLWYSYTPAADTEVQASTSGSDFDAAVSAYVGTRGFLEPVACDVGRIRFAATAGQTYHIMVGAFGSGGNLHFSLQVPPPPPPNDDFDDATVIGATPFLDAIDTSAATTADDDPSACGGRERTVWYSLTPIEDARITATTTGSDYSAFLSVFTGVRGALEHVACGALGATFTALAGRTYYFEVEASPGDVGSNLVFSVASQPPLTVGVSINSSGLVLPRAGVVTVDGRLTCSRPIHVDLQGRVLQRVGRFTLEGTFHIGVECSGDTPWSAATASLAGPFGGGWATVSVTAFAIDFYTFEIADAQASRTVQLRAGK